MKHKEYINDTCEIICEDNGTKILAEVLSFSEKKALTVSVNRSVKLNLIWNGKVYEGTQGKLSFVSDGPKITLVKTSR